ncbi:phytanoyl-CoA dioxygenase family protein [Lusitaniella coriacea LEGE 07157]|uniref:Phytanoyl-CoA dioxygenase family protein n=1 Tax=Lusitaniella coriacea LEGE 07157 TaxID=945747 RepID=A0A8J7DTX2_9CYAN|nr:phytanoyl-CoA dioxygenase family protein [Lusitaniella coriacea]MBE9114426.1 phytanoyl-CoA dioxygenase family protein [Lusitaniella coriacea LEGE 07157]
MTSIASYTEQIERDGFACIPKVLDEAQISKLKEALYAIARGNKSQPYGLRRLLEKVPAIRNLCTQSCIRHWVEPILGENAFPVRGLFFDKTVNANWGIRWHQDVTIAVQQRLEAPGFSPWSQKEGVCHVQPPLEVLEKMLALRVHLDDTGADNGCLWVVPGSHRCGRLSRQQVQKLTERGNAHPIPRGGILAMKPLLLHSSRRAATPRHRRILHLEFATEALPHGLKWYGS